MVKYVEEHNKEHDSVLLMLLNRYLIAKQVIPIIVSMPSTQLMSGDSSEVLLFPCWWKEMGLHLLRHSLVVYNLKCHIRELNGSYEHNCAYAHPTILEQPHSPPSQASRIVRPSLDPTVLSLFLVCWLMDKVSKIFPPPISIIIIPFEIVCGDWCGTVGSLCAL